MKSSFLLSTLFCLTLFGISTAQSPTNLKKVEPPFWWAGMKTPELQLLVYGENIADLQPVIDYPGVKIARTIRVKNPNYLFIDLVFAPDVQPGQFEILLQKEGQTHLKHTYKILERENGSAERQGFANADVIYLITPDRFANGNPDNDSVDDLKEGVNRSDPDGRHGGDLRGISDHLDYIQDMGFTGIWINPVLENNQERYSYHGYSTTDFYQIDARFGSNEEYVQLSYKAKAMGIKLIMDMIVNHCGSGHWWMNDLPTDDWLNNQDNFVQTNHRRSTVQDPYASQSDYHGFVDGWFVRTMPDMNAKNTLMANYLIQNAIWWIEYANLGGIRMDTYSYSDKYFLAKWVKRIMKEYPNFNIVGEEWSPNPAIVSYWQKGKINANGYNSPLPSLMDFPIQQAMSRGLNAKEASYDGIVQLYEMLAIDFLYPDPFNLVTFPDNHDMSRFFSQVNEDFGLFKLGVAFILTTRGIPQIYYGTEVLMSNPGTDRHGIIRSDFPGGWHGDKVNSFTGKGLTDQQKQAQTFLKKLLNWRRESPVIHTGKLMQFVPVFGVYVYFRYDNGARVMVLLNKNQEETVLPTERFQEMLAGITSGFDVLSGKKYDVHKELKLPARSPLILELTGD
ncbi:MAG: glycoside hydrolase family 13 protein [Deferribacteres bacterium]|nr:glycoside hydrolase family 13 protein [candidate division KSB1 bacterium]MCB9503823.1 glycoside hydrolase family 13 protein [Deferribacteres bacterium]